VDDSFARDVKGSLISLSVTKKEDNSSSINKVQTKSGSQKLVHYMVSKGFNKLKRIFKFLRFLVCRNKEMRF